MWLLRRTGLSLPLGPAWCLPVVREQLWIAPAALLDQCCGLHGKDFVSGLLCSPPLVNGLVGAQGDFLTEFHFIWCLKGGNLSIFMQYRVTFTHVHTLWSFCSTLWHSHTCTRCEVYKVLWHSNVCARCEVYALLCDIHTGVHAVRFMQYCVTFTEVCTLWCLCSTVWHSHACTRCDVYALLCDIHTSVHAVKFMQFRWLPSNAFFCFAEKTLQPLLTALELAWPHVM